VGAQACREGYRTLYFYAPKFFRALETARADGSLLPLLKKLARAPLIVVDDLGIASVPGNYIASSWRCSTTAKARAPPSSPASPGQPVARGHRRSHRGRCHPGPVGPQRLPDRNSKANPCAKEKPLLRKMNIKVRASKARLFGRAGESVTRGDRREREREFDRSFRRSPPARIDGAVCLGLTADRRPSVRLRRAQKAWPNLDSCRTPFMTPPARRFARQLSDRPGIVSDMDWNRCPLSSEYAVGSATMSRPPHMPRMSSSQLPKTTATGQFVSCCRPIAVYFALGVWPLNGAFPNKDRNRARRNLQDRLPHAAHFWGDYVGHAANVGVWQAPGRFQS